MDYTTQTVETIKQGEFVRKLNADGSMQSKTYRRAYYDRATKRYALDDYKDANRQVWVRKGTKLAVGFSY
jgi:hypothetical protein